MYQRCQWGTQDLHRIRKDLDGSGAREEKLETFSPGVPSKAWLALPSGTVKEYVLRLTRYPIAACQK